MKAELQLIAREEDGKLVLCSPSVGYFTCAKARGRMLTPGESAGVLKSLEDAYELVVPKGALGRIVSERPERVHKPVGYGTVLYELAPIESATVELADEGKRPGASSATLAVRAPYSGRFWHRPAPGDPAFVKPDDVLTEGQTLGLIEVMKTFTHLHYTPDDELPERARAVRLLADDGAEVSQGDPLIEVAPG